MSRACAVYGEEEKVLQCLVRKHEGRRLPSRPSYRWEDTLKLDLKEIKWKNVNWNNLVTDNE
jgi:hypothetical protein